MTPWFDGRLSPLDFETTSVDPEEARIVQAACGFVGAGLASDMVKLLADPGVEIEEGATAVHGITTEHARTEGLAVGEVAFAVRNVVQQAIEQGRPIVAYSARFDLTILDRECRRHGIDLPDWKAMRVVDPLIIGKWLDRFRRGSRKLSAVCEHYRVPMEGEHDALADALAAARLAYRLATRANFEARHPEVVYGRTVWKRTRGDLDALHTAQIGWAAEQAEGLAEYFRGKGKTEEAASVRPEWPLVPYVEVAV